MNDRKRGLVQAGIGLAVGVALLLWTVRKLDWTEVGDAFSSARLGWAVPIVLVVAVHYVFKGLRWKALLGDRCDTLLAVRLTMVGFLLNNVTPARTGELGRPWLLSANRPDVPLAFGVATVLADKLFDLAAVLACLGLAALVLPLPEGTSHGIIVVTAACMVVGLAAVVAARWRRSQPGGEREPATGWRAVLDQFADGLATVSSPRPALLASFWTLGSFALLALAMVWTMRMLGVDGGAMEALFVLGMLGIAFVLPAPPTHAGNYHHFATLALVTAGTATGEVAFAVAATAHAVQVVVVTVMGLVSLIGLDWRISRKSAT